MNYAQAQAIPNSLKDILDLFNSLPPCTQIPQTGRFMGQSIGPAWLVAMGLPLLKLGALAGWKGKQFYDNAKVLNIVERNKQECEVVPIDASIATYSKGQGDVLLLSYPASSPFPWNRVTDELRQLPDGRYLGITSIRLPLFSALPYPFILTGD